MSSSSSEVPQAHGLQANGTCTWGTLEVALWACWIRAEMWCNQPRRVIRRGGASMEPWWMRKGG